MWFERFNIVLQSLAREYEPYAWGEYNFSWSEIWIGVGAFGWFGMWMMLFIKFLPSVAIAEVKEIIPPPMRRGGEHSH